MAKAQCLLYIDGSIEYRERESLTEISEQHADPSRGITHLTEVGFSYPADEQCAFLVPFSLLFHVSNNIL